MTVRQKYKIAIYSKRKIKEFKLIGYPIMKLGKEIFSIFDISAKVRSVDSAFLSAISAVSLPLPPYIRRRFHRLLRFNTSELPFSLSEGAFSTSEGVIITFKGAFNTSEGVICISKIRIRLFYEGFSC